ncbi:cell wall anchor domain-containing protein, similar to Ser-Asp rich fibrinogen-binding protein SdrD [Staphylococcus schleiferi]|nr:cell wall anchor domain-containing protein, similar to Ser-Asp rich fibrinogen-binding protein SdrD [Staphylococcus schleiferi]
MKASHQGGLSPNKQNKYSIRKYTVGTASLLIGTTLIFGVHAKDASAAEEVAKQTQLAEEKTEDTAEATGESDSDLIPEVPTQDTNQDNAIEDLPEEGATSEKSVNNSEQTQEDETVVEKKQGEDKASSKTQPTPTEKSNENEKAATVDENKEQQATVAERKAVVSQPQDTEKSNATTTTPTTTESTPQPKQLAETMKQVTALEDSQEKEAKLVDYYSKNTGVSPEAAKQVVQGMNLDYQNLDSDRLTAEMLIALANKQEQNTPKATPVSLKPRSAMMRTLTLQSNNDMTAAGLATQSRNVNDLVRFSNVKVDKNQIDPNRSGRFRITAHYDVTGGIKEGDYFTVKLDSNISLDGDINYDRVDYKQTVDLLTPSGFVMANGVYDTRTKVITYTFTNWVNNKTNIKGDISLAQFTDRKNSPKSGTYSLDYDFAGESFQTKMIMTYSSPIQSHGSASVTSMITEVDQNSNISDYQQTIYVNPIEARLSSAVLTLYPYTDSRSKSSAIIDYDQTKLHIYKVNSANELTESYYFDPGNRYDYADNFYKNKSIHKDSEGNLVINFGAIDTPFVVLVDSPYNPDSKEDIKVRSALDIVSTTGVRNSFYWDNTLVVEKNSGTGIGTDAVYRLGDYVWVDKNKDGIQDLDEQPLKGVTVILRNMEGIEIKRTTTDEYGNYLFNDLQNGDYIVEFQPVQGYSFTHANAKSNTADLADSDAEFDATTNSWRAKATIKNENNMSIDAGFYKEEPPVYKIGNYVWEDINKNGIQDKDEKGVQGVLVNVFNSKNQLVDTVTTNEKGEYSVPNLPNGEYKVEFKNIPAGYTVSPSEQGNDRGADSNGLSSVITIKDEDNLTADLGIYKEIYKVGDKVWEDSNKDGIQQDTEVGISGVKVTLKDKDGKVVETKTTDEKGNYLFENVGKGEYTVEFETPQGYTPTVTGKGDSDKDSNGTSAEITVTQNDLTIDSGFYKPTYSLGDKVWEDINKNGIQDKDEKGVQGVLVNVFNSKNQLVDTVTTNEKGEYSVPNLPNGEYKVEFKNIPAGYTVSPTEQGNDRSVDSNGLSSVITIKDEDNLTADLGIYQPTFKVGDKVWEDTNKDGIQQDTEAGISGVKVTLKDKDGKVVETKTTDEKGNYLFENVTKGEYTIEFETPEGYKPTEIGKGDADKDSNGTSAKVTVDKDDITIDSGFYKPTYSLGDKVWEDRNKNGIQDEDEKGIKGVKVTLKDSTGEELDTTVTNDKGEYEFKDLPNGEYQVDFETPEGYLPTVVNTEDDTKDSDGPLNAKGVIKDEDNLTVDQGFYKKEEPPVQKPATYKVGDKVWHDTNKDGIQNVNEPGISGVTVTLKQPDGTLITTKTDKDGNYIFTDLPNGKYEISFETPEGYEATTEKAGDDRRLDSDGKTVAVEVNNADDLTIDSGFYKKEEPPVQKPATYKVGDKVWHDTNKDGIQNVNEPGISGVTVTLKQPDGTLITTKTDKDGNYIFKDLPNGKYEISFETPEGYEATAEKAGDDRRLDSDGKTVTVEVNNADDLTIDSGFYKKEEPPVQKPATYKVGDKVWHDTNKDGIQNVNEPGISGVTVTLKQPDGTLITTKTDKDGNYIFKQIYRMVNTKSALKRQKVMKQQQRM